MNPYCVNEKELFAWLNKSENAQKIVPPKKRKFETRWVEKIMMGLYKDLNTADIDYGNWIDGLFFRNLYTDAGTRQHNVLHVRSKDHELLNFFSLKLGIKMTVDCLSSSREHQSDIQCQINPDNRVHSKSCMLKILKYVTAFQYLSQEPHWVEYSFALFKGKVYTIKNPKEYSLIQRHYAYVTPQGLEETERQLCSIFKLPTLALSLQTAYKNPSANPIEGSEVKKKIIYLTTEQFLGYKANSSRLETSALRILGETLFSKHPFFNFIAHCIFSGQWGTGSPVFVIHLVPGDLFVMQTSAQISEKSLNAFKMHLAYIPPIKQSVGAGASKKTTHKDSVCPCKSLDGYYNLKSKNKMAKPCGTELAKKDLILNLKAIGFYNEITNKMILCCNLLSISSFDIESLTVPATQCRETRPRHGLIKIIKLESTDSEQILASQHMFLLGYQFTVPMETLKTLMVCCFGKVFEKKLSRYLDHKISFKAMMRVVSPLISEKKTNLFITKLWEKMATFKKNPEPETVQFLHLARNGQPDAGIQEPNNKNMFNMIDKVSFVFSYYKRIPHDKKLIFCFF